MQHRELDHIPMSEVDRCLRVLHEKVEMASEEVLEYLINSRYSSDYDFAIYLVVDDIFQLIRLGQLHRWDFDPNDEGHKDQQKTEMTSDWMPPAGWSKSDKQRILYDIIGCFRTRCHALVEKYITRFEGAGSIREVWQIKDEVLKEGLLIESQKTFTHSHSMPHTKHVFRAYHEALERFPH